LGGIVQEKNAQLFCATLPPTPIAAGMQTTIEGKEVVEKKNIEAVSCRLTEFGH